MIDVINKWISDFILFVGREAATFWENITLLQFSWSQVLIDILLVSILFYYIFVLLKGTRAVHILIGLIILVFLALLSKTLSLFALGWLLDRFLTLIIVAIPIIFQQELRRGLERLGQAKIFSTTKSREADILINNIKEACNTLAQNKKGALIAFKGKVSLNEYEETGVPLDSKISKELLLSIFDKNSPLHDGAVIVDDNKIKAAACTLPHSLKSHGTAFGTRHKAALGLSETTDANVVVISEEKGAISFATQGRIERNIDQERLGVHLASILKPKPRIKRRKKVTKK